MGQAALNADFRCAKLPGLERFLPDLFRRQKISIRLARTAAEGAEFASDEANIRKVDVAIDDIGHEITAEFGAQNIRSHQQPEQIAALAVGQSKTLIKAQSSPILRFED